MESNRRLTVRRQLQAWNEWSIEKIMGDRAEDCVHQLMPSGSLKVPPMDNATFRKHLDTNVLPNYRNFKVEADDVIEDEKENKIAVLAHSTADTDIGLYENQYVFVMYFNHEGTKFVRVVEFVDSAKIGGFVAKLRAHAAAKASQ